MTKTKAKGKRGRDRPITKHGGSVPSDIADPAYLTDAELHRRDKFVHLYAADGILWKAAEEAGYTGTKQSLTKQGSRLMQEPWVKDRLDELRTDLLNELRINARTVLAEYARIAFFDIGKCFNDKGELLPMNKIPLDTRRALAGFEITRKQFGSGEEGMEVDERKVKAANKTAALDQLARYLGIIKTDDPGGDRLTPEEFMRRMLAARERHQSMRATIDQARIMERVVADQ